MDKQLRKELARSGKKIEDLNREITHTKYYPNTPFRSPAYGIGVNGHTYDDRLDIDDYSGDSAYIEQLEHLALDEIPDEDIPVE